MGPAIRDFRVKVSSSDRWRRGVKTKFQLRIREKGGRNWEGDSRMQRADSYWCGGCFIRWLGCASSLMVEYLTLGMSGYVCEISLPGGLLDWIISGNVASWGMGADLWTAEARMFERLVVEWMWNSGLRPAAHGGLGAAKEAENFSETEGVCRSLGWKPNNCIMAVRVKTTQSILK